MPRAGRPTPVVSSAAAGSRARGGRAGMPPTVVSLCVDRRRPGYLGWYRSVGAAPDAGRMRSQALIRPFSCLLGGRLLGVGRRLVLGGRPLDASALDPPIWQPAPTTNAVAGW